MRQVLIVVPKSDELRGLAQAFEVQFEEPDGRLQQSNKDYFHLELRAETSDGIESISVVVVLMGDQGNLQSLGTTRDAINVFDPDIVCLCGTAVGIEEHITAGSVLVSSRAFDATEWVFESKQKTPRCRPAFPPEAIRRDLETFICSGFDENAWKNQCESRRQSSHGTDEGPSGLWTSDMGIKLRGIAGLNVLHKHQESLEQLHKTNDYIWAADMETAGFVFACTSDKPPRQWFIARGISDYGTRASKCEAYRPLAAYSAGLFLRSLLTRGLNLAKPGSQGVARDKLRRDARACYAPAAGRVEACSLYPKTTEGEDYSTGSDRVGGTSYRIQTPQEFFGEEFASRYAGANLLKMFEKTYPITLVAENIALLESNVHCELATDRDGKPRRFELPPIVEPLRPDLLKVHARMRGNSLRWSDDLSRLTKCTLIAPEGLEQEGHHLDLEFEVCEYEDYVVTNYSVPIRRLGLPSVGVILDSLCGSPERPAQLSSELPYANQLGLNAMLITSDGRMPYVERSTKEFTFPGQMGTPVSGTQMYWYKKDRVVTSHIGVKNVVKKGPAESYYGKNTAGGHGIPNPFRGVMAQAREEVGLNPGHVKECYLLGINRDLTRGGLPDAFFVIYLDCTWELLVSEEPEAATDSWEWERLRALEFPSGPLQFGDVQSAFRHFLESEIVSTPLITNMYLLLQYLKAREED